MNCSISSIIVYISEPVLSQLLKCIISYTSHTSVHHLKVGYGTMPVLYSGQLKSSETVPVANDRSVALSCA